MEMLSERESGMSHDISTVSKSQSLSFVIALENVATEREGCLMMAGLWQSPNISVLILEMLLERESVLSHNISTMIKSRPFSSVILSENIS